MTEYAMKTVNCIRCDFFHKDDGNCTAVGGFCTAVAAAHCPVLKKYFNTGLTPEQCENAKTIIESAFNDDTSKAERIRELLRADKDGRLVVLPCKVGDTVWRIKRTFETYPDKSKPYIEPDAFLLQDVFNIGKNVFLTREEAEKALQEMEGKKDE